jgi:2-polyprenyl-3-methyl-5-hydroxy-6-metoxy-1,4-benzoquinol methylase
MNAELLERDATSEITKLEETACLICGGGDYETVLGMSSSPYRVVRCRCCKLHFTNPRPTLESIGNCYPPQYRPHSGKAHHRRPLRSWYPLDWLQLPPHDAARPRLLDFGCGAGHFLAAMDRDGWEVIGLDASSTAAAAIRDEIGLAARAGSLPHEKLEPSSFECITMWHSLEHVHDPLRIVREARRLLTPGGRLIVAVPNFAGWSRRRFGPNWFGLDLPRHLTHFEAATLTRLLEMAGLRTRELRFSRHADWIRSSAQQARVGFVNRLMSNRGIAALVARYGMRMADGDALLAIAERT